VKLVLNFDDIVIVIVIVILIICFMTICVVTNICFTSKSYFYK